MTGFRFVPLTPHPRMQPYVAKLWVFESKGRMPELEKKLIVPNGNFKLAFAYRNGIGTRIAGKSYVMPEYQLTLSGLIDEPVELDTQYDAPTGTIGVEFKALGAYRFFRLGYAELRNQILPLEDLAGPEVSALRWRMAESSSVTTKVDLLQNYLLKRLGSGLDEPIFDYCTGRILDSCGTVSVAELEKETGYSTRWLHNKFAENLGTGPKNLAAIIRFGKFYEAFAAGQQEDELKARIYEYYHDQSHFLRSFKRFTGTTPTQLQQSLNELGTHAFRA